MFVVLYVVAAAMVVGGAFAVLTGWEILLLERGWSMVIAGATLATGGLVLAGVAAAARALATRLDSLADAVRASRNAAAPAFPRRPGTSAADAAELSAPAPSETSAAPHSREIAPKLPPQDAATPAGPAPAAALGIGGVAAEAIAPSLKTAPPEPDGGLPPLDLGPVPERPSDEPKAEAMRAEGLQLEKPQGEELWIEPPSADAPPAPPASEADAVADAQPETPAAPPVAPEKEEEKEEEEEQEQEEADAAVVPRAGIEEPILSPREPSRIAAEADALTRRHEANEPAPLPAEPVAHESAEAQPAADEITPAPSHVPGEVPEEAADDAAPADAPRAEDAALGETPDEAGAEPPAPPHVVGTHVSGANRYVMYSDGSIEAETPDGRLVFGSIEELKGYVASSGEDPSGASRTGPG
ncbi:hypothetical protein ACTZWW_15910 [Salinarimonas sp. NSM]|uniref:hypothetical protein n=1 Tax=Salinarimonas sp. NSM TaxID=3458003 RepID=UPI0040364ABC